MATMSKLDYLKRYADDSKKKNKKKKKLKTIKNNMKIVDNDITFKNPSGHLDDNDDDDDDGLYDLQEEKPTLFAADGATILTKEYEDEQKKKQARWKTLDTQKTGNNSKVSSGQERHVSDHDMSPVRTKRRHDSDDSDLSPARPRGRKRHDSDDDDMSPKRNDDSDISPKRKQRHDSSDSDMSPERPSKQKSTDLSPKRKRAGSSDEDLSPIRNKSHQRKRKLEEPEVMSTGRKAGLQSGKELKEENKRKRELEKRLLDTMDESVSGKGSTTVYRDRTTGKKIDLKFEELKKKQLEDAKLIEKEKHAVWGKGVAQTDDYQQKLHDDLHEADKPLARYKDDKDLDSLLKVKDREGDPMLAYLTKKKEKVTTSKLPRYNGPTPPANRFNIWPGYRFDGVDRSNGFEKKRFMAISQQKSVSVDAYKWSVEDM